MNRTIQYTISLITLLFLLSGCKDETWDNDTNTSATYGTLQLSEMKIEIANSKAVNSRDLTDTEDYIIEIYRDGAIYRSFSRYGAMPEKLELPTGTYTVKARSGDVLAASWFSPYYEGENIITIEENKQSTVNTITCRLANIMVTVNIEGRLRELVSADSHVDVAYQNEADFSKILSYDLTAIDEGHEGYFAYLEGGKTLIAIFRGSIDGEPAVKEFACIDLLPGEHRIITFAIKDDPVIPDDDDPGNGDDDDPNNGGDPGNGDDDDPNNGGDTGNGDDDDPNNGGDTGNGDDDDPKLPEIDETIGSFTLDNGITIEVRMKIIKLSFTIPGEDDAVLGGILRPGDPGYTGNEDPSVSNPEYPWYNEDDNKGDNGEKEPDEGDDPEPGPTHPPVVWPTDPLPLPTVETVSYDSEYLSLIPENPNKVSDFGPDKKAASLIIESSRGFSHIYVKIQSPALTPDELYGIGLVDSFDLAYPGDYRDALVTGLGVPVGDDVIGQHRVLFDVTEFIPLIDLLDAKGEHHFIITAEDIDGKSAELDLLFVN